MNVSTGKIYEKWDADIEPGSAGAEGKHFGGVYRDCFVLDTSKGSGMERFVREQGIPRKDAKEQGRKALFVFG